MTMIRLRVFYLFVFAAFGSSASAQDAKRIIEVPLAMPAAKAADHVQLVAVRQELAIVSNQGGVIQLEPHRVRKNNPTTVTLRINILSTSDSTSIAVVSGRWFSPLIAGQQRILLGRDNAITKEEGVPVESATKGWKAELWKVVQDFAASIGALT